MLWELDLSLFLRALPVWLEVFSSAPFVSNTQPRILLNSRAFRRTLESRPQFAYPVIMRPGLK